MFHSPIARLHPYLDLEKTVYMSMKLIVIVDYVMTRLHTNT